MKEQVFTAVSGRSGFYIRLIGTVLAIILLAYLLSQQSWEAIKAALLQIEPWRFVAAMGLMILSRFAVAGRWHVLLRSSKIKISFWDTLRITFAGLFSTNFLPTTVGGDVIRLAGAIQLKFDGAISAASLIVDRLVGMAGMALMLPFGLPSFLAVQSQAVNALPWPTMPMAGILATSMEFINKLWSKGLRILRRILAALSIWKKEPQSLLQSLVMTLINMAGLFGVLYLIFQGEGEDISFWLIGGLYSIVYFITLLPFSINGYGIQEVSMTFIFSAVGGVSVQSALTAALLFRTMMMIASLPGAAFVPGLMAGVRSQTADE